MQVPVIQGNPVIISLHGAVVTSDGNGPIGRNHNPQLQDQVELDTIKCHGRVSKGRWAQKGTDAVYPVGIFSLHPPPLHSELSEGSSLIYIWEGQVSGEGVGQQGKRDNHSLMVEQKSHKAFSLPLGPQYFLELPVLSGPASWPGKSSLCWGRIK